MSLFEIITKCVSSAIAARQTREKPYCRIAVTNHTQIKDWNGKGNPNVAHLDAFLDAQFSAMNGKRFAAIKSF